MPPMLTMRCEVQAESGATIPEGALVEYLGHLPGGMVRVGYKGREEVIHPLATLELR